MPLRRFLSLVESRQDFCYPTPLLGDAIGIGAKDALCAAGVLAAHGPATWYPCARGLRGCVRIVAADPAAAKLHALCGRSPSQCPTDSFAEHELGQHELCEAALATLLQGLFEAQGQAVGRHGRGAILSLGQKEPGPAGRELWLWLRPKEPDFSQWARDLEDRPRQAIVLVPTPALVHADTFNRYGPGRPVQIMYLNHTLTIEGGRIVRAEEGVAPPARVPWATERHVERSHARVHTPAGTRWGDITIEKVDGHVVAVRIGDRAPARLSAAEFGMTSEANGEPTEQWKLLLELCDGSGTCTRGSVGASSMDVLKVRMRRLGIRLCAVFGIAELPLHVSSDDESVRTEFRAFPHTRRETDRER